MYANIQPDPQRTGDGTYEFGVTPDTRVATTFYLDPNSRLYATDQCSPALIDAQTDPAESIFFRTMSNDGGGFQHITCQFPAAGSTALVCSSSYGSTTFYCPPGVTDGSGVPEESVGIGAYVFHGCAPITLTPVQVPSYYMN